MRKYSSLAIVAVLALFSARAWCDGGHIINGKGAPAVRSEDSEWSRFRIAADLLQDKWTEKRLNHFPSTSAMFSYPYFPFDIAVREKLSYDDCSKMIREWNRIYHHDVDPRLQFSQATYDKRYKKDRAAYVAGWRRIEEQARKLDLKQYGPEFVKEFDEHSYGPGDSDDPMDPANMGIPFKKPAWVEKVEKDLPLDSPSSSR